jgi:hypothetical protein
MLNRPRVRLLLLHAAVLGFMTAACSATDPDAADASATPTSTAATTRCLPDAGGYLRAQLRGAINADLDWRDADIRCEGGARPDGEGLRVSIAGPLPASAGDHAGRTLRFVFGIDTAAAVTEGTALATNLTAIVEGAAGSSDPALFATRGDDKCTVDRLQRRDAAGAATGAKDYRVDARGFCLGPATSLDGQTRLLVTTFDFAGRVSLDTAP